MNISDKVVCLCDFNELDQRFKVFHPTLPEKGKTYVIRGTLDYNVKNCPIKGLYLVGIQSLNNTNGQEQSFSSFEFCLLKDYKTKFGGEYDFLNKEL